MNGASEADILKAVQALDEKMGRAMQKQTETLSRRIQEIADHHATATLEQERRNATFATTIRTDTVADVASVRTEAVAEHLHKLANTVQETVLRQADLRERLTKMEGKSGITWQRYLAIGAVVSGPASVILALILRLSFG